MIKIHILHQKTQPAQVTTSKARQLPVRRVMIGCLTHHPIHLDRLRILTTLEQDSISLRHTSGTGSTLLNIPIPTIRAINTLLPQEVTVNTISRLQMPIVYHRHSPGQATHILLLITMRPLKHLHLVSELQSPANIVARERFVAQVMKAPPKVVARIVSASTNNASSIRCHLKVLLFRHQLSTGHRLVPHAVPILKETIVHNSADTHGMENHRCYMELMDNL